LVFESLKFGDLQRIHFQTYESRCELFEQRFYFLLFYGNPYVKLLDPWQPNIGQ